MFNGVDYSSSKVDDNDDLYGGYNYNVDDFDPVNQPGTGAFGGGHSLSGNSNFSNHNPLAATLPVRGAHGFNMPGTAMGKGPPGTQMGRGIPGSRMMTSQQHSGEARPMTSVNGAGYQSKPTRSSHGFDPLNQANLGPAPALVETSENSPEERAKEMEKQVNALIEESATLAERGEALKALEKAKEANKKEKKLCTFREQNQLGEHINYDLTYSTCFNLANAYQINEMYTEALDTYTLIVKNRQYVQSGRLRINMGNIYFQQEKYPNAIRMYRMALDQIPNTNKEMRFKVMRNIGNAFVKLGQFQEAIQSFEAIMEGHADYQTGFNLVVCYYALGDVEQMKAGFTRLLSIPILGESEGEEDDEEEEEEETKESGKENIRSRNYDELKVEQKEREKKARTYVLNAAKLIASNMDRKEWAAGYNWVIDSLRHSNSFLASEMEIVKAIAYLRRKDFKQAIDVLKSFEKKDHSLKAKAATNLSFLYFLEGDISSADKYANLAVRNDRYNAKALVNKGNCLYKKGEYERAKELFLEAIGVEADCSEAIYNLGLTNKKMGKLNEALQAFEKLHTIIPNSPEVIFQIACLYDQLMNFRASQKWFNILITRVPTDPGVLSKLGQIFSKNDEDKTQALHFHHESYRYYPVNLEVISWLGVWYVKNELYEKAIEFFNRASQIQPNEVKWRLMVTSCYRRMSAYQKALQLYEEIHKEWPNNVECLIYLVAICKDLGMPYNQYEMKRAKLERSHTVTRGGGGVGQLTQAAGMNQMAVPGRAPSSQNGGYEDPRSEGRGNMKPRRNMEAIGEREDEDEEPQDDVQIQHNIGERGQRIKSRKADELDDWNDADIDDLLAE